MQKKERGFKRPKLLPTLAVLVVVASVATAGYFYYENNKIKNDPSALLNLQNKEADELKAKVGKLIDLPSDEKPVVATIQDKQKLKDQPFFNGAENNDKLLIFTNAKKAIIYREAANKIINVGPIAVNTSDLGNGKKVAILNGSNNADANKTAETNLTASFTGMVIASKGDAAKRDYKKTAILDVSGNNGDLVKQMADLLGGEVISSLPEGENQPSGVDVLVIAVQ